ncbi:unnamed protein product, partial [Porites lobata]
QSSEDDLVDLNLIHNVDVRIGAGSERRYVPLRAPSCSFQPIRSDSRIQFFLFNPFKDGFLVHRCYTVMMYTLMNLIIP